MWFKLGFWLFVIGKEDVRRNTLLSVLQRSVTLSIPTRVVSHCEEDQSCGQSLQQALVAARFESCSVCGSDSLSPNGTRTPTKLSGDDDDDDDDDESHKAKEIVPVKGLEELVRKQAEPIPGWPLLRRTFSSTGQPITTRKQIPVAQWALKLPPRNIKQIGYDSSPDNSQRKLPEELERLYKRFSSTCQFFKYKELVSVTSDFSPGVFLMTCLQFLKHLVM